MLLLLKNIQLDFYLFQLHYIHISYISQSDNKKYQYYMSTSILGVIHIKFRNNFVFVIYILPITSHYFRRNIRINAKFQQL